MPTAPPRHGRRPPLHYYSIANARARQNREHFGNVLRQRRISRTRHPSGAQASPVRPPALADRALWARESAPCGSGTNRGDAGERRGERDSNACRRSARTHGVAWGRWRRRGKSTSSGMAVDLTAHDAATTSMRGCGSPDTGPCQIRATPRGLGNSYGCRSVHPDTAGDGRWDAFSAPLFSRETCPPLNRVGAAAPTRNGLATKRWVKTYSPNTYVSMRTRPSTKFLRPRTSNQTSLCISCYSAAKQMTSCCVELSLNQRTGSAAGGR